MHKYDENLASEIQSFLRERLGGDLAVAPFDTHSAKVVLRAEFPDGQRMFVKLVKTSKGEELRKMADELDLPFVAKVIHLFPWDDENSILCQEWQKGCHIKPEDMTSKQCASLIAATERLQSALKASHVMQPRQDLEGAYTVIDAFARRHPLMRPLLRPILDIPTEERTYSPALLAVIHGDQHYENYLFDGDEISAIMDFESVTFGTRAQDLAYIIIRRLYKARLDKAQVRHLQQLFAQMIESPSFSRLECILSVNLWRVVFASRRLAAHPFFGPVAWLVWKRDRPIRALLNAIPASKK